jgi:hypothetical protein
MDESALQTRLTRIERLLTLTVVILVAQVLHDVAVVLGTWVTGVLAATLALLAVATVVYTRRLGRDTAGG